MLRGDVANLVDDYSEHDRNSRYQRPSSALGTMIFSMLYTFKEEKCPNAF